MKKKTFKAMLCLLRENLRQDPVLYEIRMLLGGASGVKVVL